MTRRKTTTAIGTPGYFGRRLKIWRYQRSAGKHIPRTPFWVSWEHVNTKEAGYFTLSLGNPRAHARWAFMAYFYYKGV